MITANETDFLSFFEVEPKLGYPDLPWAYNKSTYRAIVCGSKVDATLEPNESCIGLNVIDPTGAEHSISIKMAKDIVYEATGSSDALKVIVDDASSIELALRPKFRITYHYNGFSLLR